MKITNMQIIPNDSGGHIVIGDTKRFGIQKVLFEGIRKYECLEYAEQHECYSYYPELNYSLTYLGGIGFTSIEMETKEQCLQFAKELAYAKCTPMQLMKYNKEKDIFEVIGNFTKKQK